MSEIIDWPPERALDTAIVTRISAIIEVGGLIVYPTSNLYGLGAGISSKSGLDKLIRTKNRPDDMPVSIMASKQQIEELCIVNELAAIFIKQGSISVTVVLPASEKAPESVTYNGTVAVRFPCSELTRSLVDALGPVTATSANIHGQDAPFTIEDTESQLRDNVSLYLNGGRLSGTPTTLIDLTGQQPKVLREGLIPANEVHDIYGR